MKRILQGKFFIFTLLIAAVGILYYWTQLPEARTSLSSLPSEPVAALQARSSFSPKNTEDAISRADFEHMRLRDPRTGQIPRNIRERELAFVSGIPDRESLLQKGARQLFAADWSPRGPFNVGGRTRALGIDLDYNGTTNRRILAGGISGGIYLSSNGGSSWQLKTSLAALPSVTALTQDPNNRNIWYAGTGEFVSNSAGGIGGFGYLGQGIYKSTDNGDSWNLLPSEITNNKPNVFDSDFDYIWNIKVHPQTGTIFVASHAAIYRSVDGGNTWQGLIGRGQPPFSVFSDVAIGADGRVYATLSRNGGGFDEYGVYVSDNDGLNWTNITPNALVQDPYRMVLAASPSDANTVYLLVQATAAGEKAGDHQLFRSDLNNSRVFDLSANLPNPTGVVGTFNSQQGYDLIVYVKPDNPNVVWIGGTNLHRSTDGGQNWSLVGGYVAPDVIGLYENHHPDQHSIAFYPNNPNAMISGHDGGLSQTNNVLQQPQQWVSLNNGYMTTQFYGIAVDPQPGSSFLVGGMQDNGTWAVDSLDFQTPWSDIAGGDGGFSAVAPGYDPFYVSLQNGTTFRITLGNNSLDYAQVTPAGADNFLFIAPYILDQNDYNVMYFAAGNTVWRNSNLLDIPNGNNQPTNINWTALSNNTLQNVVVTTLAVSRTPGNRLYYGATDASANTYIVRIDDPVNDIAGTFVTPPGVTGGSWPTSIAINPNNADEIIATFGNYHVPSIWYSDDGGASWADIEGNLAGEDGPSVRWSAIIPTGGATLYFLATSTGIYSAMALNGNNTAWVQEGASPIGNVVVDMLATRPADGLIAAGTHGRGVFTATVAGVGGVAVLDVNTQQLTIDTESGGMGSNSFVLSNTGTAPLNYSIAASGNFTTIPKAGYQGMLQKQLLSGKSVRQRPFVFSNKTGPKRNIERAFWNKANPADLADFSLSSGEDELILDDGNDSADDFFGNADGENSFFWMNRFTPSGFDYTLDGFAFFMRTEFNPTNEVYFGVNDASGNVLASGTLDLALAQDGAWYQIDLSNTIDFGDGETFFIEIGADAFIDYPAGTDADGAVPSNSFYFDTFSQTYVNLNTFGGFENGAFLIRALGTIAGGQNQPPVANAQVSKTQAQVNESITFDASGSFDPDGQITQYNWAFGDGSTSSQQVATHAYSVQS